MSCPFLHAERMSLRLEDTPILTGMYIYIYVYIYIYIYIEIIVDKPILSDNPWLDRLSPNAIFGLD